MLLLTASLLHAAEDCREPLEIREFFPRSGDVEMPLDVRVLVAFIGWGTLDQYTVSLTGTGGKPIQSTVESWCYEHEGPHEVHCWTSIKPDKPLTPKTDHHISIETSDKWPHNDGGRSIRAVFTTGTAMAEPITGIPSLELVKVWTKKNKECGYPVARRYDLAPTVLQEDDETGGAVFHLYPLNEYGEPGENIHTVFSGWSPPEGIKTTRKTKQYLDGSLSHTDCFRMIEEDMAGNRTEPFDTCEFATDTGQADTALPADTAPPTDTALPADTGLTEAGLTNISAEVTCGCRDSHWEAALLLAPLLLWRRRSSSSQTARQ